MFNDYKEKKILAIIFTLIFCSLLLIFNKYKEEKKFENDTNYIQNKTKQYLINLSEEKNILNDFEKTMLEEKLNSNYVNLNNTLRSITLYTSFLEIVEKLNNESKHISVYKTSKIQYKMIYNNNESSKSFEFYIRNFKNEYVLVSTIYMFDLFKNDIYIKNNEFLDTNALRFFIKYFIAKNMEGYN